MRLLASIAAYLILTLVAPYSALADCQRQTILQPDGSVKTCTICCNLGRCNTFCE